MYNIAFSLVFWQPFEYQPSGAGGTRSPPATLHCLQNPKWPPGGPKKGDRAWKGVQP